jgi:RND family efflux transporter MFP subunit
MQSLKFFLLAIVVLGLGACGNSKSQDSATEPTAVRAQAATSGPGAPPIDTSGIVATKDEMRLSFKVGGVVRRIAVQEGQTVKQGQILAEIEPTEINAQVQTAWELNEKARRDLERGERLFKDEVITLEQLQDLRTQASTARAQLAANRFNQGYAVISAPRAGVVLRKLIEERELVPAGQPVLVLGAQDRGYIVRATLSDREVVQVKLGDPIEVELDAWPDRKVPGTLIEVANAADERSGMFTIEAKIDSQPLPLATGLVAKIQVYPASSRSETLTYIPVAALISGEGKNASVFMAQADKAVRRNVRVAFLTGDRAALASGVEPGEIVIAEGALYLVDGESIRIVDDASRVSNTNNLSRRDRS